jgi:SAM-dependent methyltransferase
MPTSPMSDPCAFSPGIRQATAIARFFAAMFPKGATVVDVGFGQGVFLEQARLVGLNAVGIDRDARLVANANERGLSAFECDVRDLSQIIENPVDGIMAAHLIEHLTADDLVQFLHDVATFVRPGGIAVLATPNFKDWRVASEWFWNDPTHIRPYPPGAIQQMIDPAEWIWDMSGHVPVVITRELPKVILKRFVYGTEYGKPGLWYRLTRS